MRPVEGNPLQKREDFAVSLRKKKRDENIQAKRRKLDRLEAHEKEPKDSTYFGWEEFNDQAFYQ